MNKNVVFLKRLGDGYKILCRSLLLTVFSCCIWQCAGPSSAAFSYPAEKVAEGRRAALASAHPLATRVGAAILQKGGNAIDAAVAVQFALAVVYPQAGNIGGGGFLVYHEKSTGKSYTLDYREKAPLSATETMFQDEMGQVLADKSRYGIFAAGVPGTVHGMWEAHRRFGKLPWKTLLLPAIRLAKKGYRITTREAQQLDSECGTFARYNPFHHPAFVKDEAWKAGDWLVQPELASTLKRISEAGPKGFYEGEVARLMVEEMKRQGGLMTLDDLARYRSVWRDPVVFSYQDSFTVITMPPPSSGGILLQQLLGMVAPYPLEKYGFHSAPAIHVMAEAERRAYADRAMHHGDPDFWQVPAKALVDPAYLRRRMGNFDATAATPSTEIEAGNFGESEETTHYSIVDAQGNAVAVTTTLNDSYGSRVVVAGAGFILNNEMDDFSAKPGTPNLYGAIGGKANAVAPGKRPLSSMTPTIVLKNNTSWLVVGSPGGTTIPTTVFQIIVNLTRFGMPLPEAVKAGRFHHQWKPDAIQVEPGGLPPGAQKILGGMGHVIMQRSSHIGRVEAVIRLSDGRWQAVADTRGDDAAMGF